MKRQKVIKILWIILSVVVVISMVALPILMGF
jgi:hypothetical protein